MGSKSRECCAAYYITVSCVTYSYIIWMHHHRHHFISGDPPTRVPFVIRVATQSPIGGPVAESIVVHSIYDWQTHIDFNSWARREDLLAEVTQEYRARVHTRLKRLLSQCNTLPTHMIWMLDDVLSYVEV